MSTTRYFSILTGLRGCYMPEDSCVIAVKTRRHLKFLLLDRRDFLSEDWRSAAEMRHDGYYYASDREVASAAAELWCRKPTHSNSHLATVIPYGPGGSCGIQVTPIDRAEYLAQHDSTD